MNSDFKSDLTYRHFFFLWFGAAISMAEILTGGLLAPLGVKAGLQVILIGHGVGVTILILGGIIGSRERMAALSSTRISFGLYGSYLFSICNLLQLLGWTAVMIVSAARSINFITIKLWHFDSLICWNILLGLLVIGWIISGKTGFKKINIAAVSLLFILTLALSVAVFQDNKLWTQAGRITASNWGMGMELNILMPLSWLPLIADYTRFAKTTKGGVFGSWWGYFLGSSWMYVIGLGSILVSKNPDPSGLMLATGLGFAALGIVILATVTTTFMDVYSAGVTFLNIFPKFKEKQVAVITGLIGTVIAIIIPIEHYQNFLYAIGTIFAPLFTILFTDYFFSKNRKTLQEKLLVDWGALLVWGCGVILYQFFIQTHFVFGATLPVMVLTSLIYLFTRRIFQWKQYRKLPDC